MKAVTLTQPWATLVAIGAKKIETRSWGTEYRGPLAIHAAKAFPMECRELCGSYPFYEFLQHAGLGLASGNLPRGYIVATCDLVTVERMHHIGSIGGWDRPMPDGSRHRWWLDSDERTFGQYEDGRYAWLLHNVLRLADPIPARGSLGLWEWRP